MFTLEDLDLADDLAYIRGHASRYLPQDLAQDGRRPGDVVAPSTGGDAPDSTEDEFAN
ncbi:MAG: hypothetical protein Q4G43_06545 [Mobilicoccus sp.]|nr:hypothetical protein [Mobilicoccus sp.]